MKRITVFLLLLSSGQLFAAGYTYNPVTGSIHHTYENHDGSSTTDGYNTNTGAAWNITTDPNGNMRGRDSDGNYWSYDNGTGTYYNYGNSEPKSKPSR